MKERSLTTDLTVSASMPQFRLNAAESVKVGFLAPLTGDASSWGEPGYQGCRIREDWINATGGLYFGGANHRLEVLPFDCRYDPGLALAGARKLIFEDGVKFLMMLGGDTFAAVEGLVVANKMLTSTLLPSDLSPDTPYLIAPSEVHPIYNVTGVDWLGEHRPDLATVALCAQRDALGMPSIATYRSAFEAAGIAIVKEVFFPIEAFDRAAVVAAMMEAGPDILCWDTAYEPLVHALTEEAFARGFRGQIISCTADNYTRLVARTSAEFMQGFLFQFPDFDDPALNAPRINFPRPNKFYEEFNRRFPGNWSAVSWEYVSILDMWRSAVEIAGSTAPVSVLAAMKSGGHGKHAFGEASWWGSDLFGIDNALVGDWPVVMIDNGKARIQEFRSVIAWWDQYGDLLVRHMQQLGQMWHQRIAMGEPGDDRAVPRRRFVGQPEAE